jgi:hypothetical protein
MKYLLKVTIALILAFGLNTLNAQELVSTTGGVYSDANLNVSWSVGEVAIETFTDGNYVLTQGFQQPGLVLVGVEDFDEQFSNIKVYPNPTSDYVRLDLNVDIQNLSYRVLNASGKIIENKKIQDPSTRVSFTEVESGLYLIHLMDGEKTMKIFRIVKN